jgi:hypothetical protein
MEVFMRQALVVLSLVLASSGRAPAAMLPWIDDQDAALERAPVLVEMTRLRAREVRREGFTLGRPQAVRIEAAGAESGSWGRLSWVRTMWGRDEEPRTWAGNAWILDLTSRRVVWELRSSRTRNGGGGSRVFEGDVQLPAGTSAAYYAAFPDGYAGGDDNSWSRFWRGALDGFALRIEGSGTRLSKADVDHADHAFREGAALVLVGSGPGRIAQAGFQVTRTTDVDVRAIGELGEEGQYDYAWIVDADTRKRIWRMNWDGSNPAGGAVKNRLERRSIPFMPGRYAVFYGTDDSHDPTGWNAPPPYDPVGWGIILRAKDPAAVSPYKYEHVPAAATIVDMTRVGDGEARREGFTLTRPMDVRIYALGEGREDAMYDYAWITSADTRRRVWQMRYDDTEAAGGDAKNRVVDTVLRLDKGSYLVHYVTDGSHSFPEWNSAAPPDGARWGVTVLSADGRLDKSAIAAYEPRSDSSLLAAAVRVSDDDRVQRRFTLQSDALVRIVATGEGSDGDMYDFGWIEDVRTGRRMWEMTYRSTEHAGGASKNRRFEGTIKLPAGEYAIVYQTDGSHAFGEWNADPPDDPEGWGISVYRAR